MGQTQNRIHEGDLAPDFSLKDQENKEIRLSDLKGKRVLLSFHPLAWTPVCTHQMSSPEKNTSRFAELNTIPLGIRVDSQPRKAAWVEHLGIKSTRLLADFWPRGGAAMALGLFREKHGFSERANVILNEDQKVVFVKVYPSSELSDIDEVLSFLSRKWGGLGAPGRKLGCSR